MINYKLAYSFTAIVFLVLAGFNLIGTNVLSTQGIVVSEAETQTMTLEKENHHLSVMIEESSNFSEMQKIAEGRGFVKSRNIVFAPTTSSFASR